MTATSPTNTWKLGLFVVLGLAVAAGSVLYFGGGTFRRQSVPYRTYFDESVQGLDVGASVKYRGVSIGSVSDIDLAPDRRHVAVTYELGVKVLDGLGLSVVKDAGGHTKLVIPADLRVQLASSGLTGVKLLELDLFDVASHPAAALPFEVPGNTIPAAPSVMKGLEDSVVNAVERFPALTERMEAVIVQVQSLVADVQRAKLPELIAEALVVLSQVVHQVSAAIAALDTPRLGREAHQTLVRLNGVLEAVDKVVARLDGEKGLVASAQRTSDALGHLAADNTRAGPELEQSLKAVQSAARAVQRLADDLQEDPDMLLKGRAKRVTR